MIRLVHVIPRYLPCIGGAEMDLSLWIRACSDAAHTVICCFDEDLNWYSESPDMLPVEDSSYTVSGALVTRVGVGRDARAHLGALAHEALPFHPAAALSSSFYQRLVGIFEERIRAVARGSSGVTLAYCGCNFLAEACLNAVRDIRVPLLVVPNLHVEDAAFVSPILKRALSEATRVVCRTSAEARVVATDYRVARDAIRVVPVFRPEVIAKPRRSELRAGAIRCLALGQLLPFKRTEHIIAAVRSLIARDVQVSLTIAGPWPHAGYRRDLECMRHGLPIDILGPVSEKQKLELLDSHDVAISASVEESFGGWILEAWARMCCVAVAKSISSQEIIDHLRTGMLFSPCSDGCAETIEFLAKNPAIRGQLGQNGQREYREKYSEEAWGPVVRRLLYGLGQEG